MADVLRDKTQVLFTLNSAHVYHSSPVPNSLNNTVNFVKLATVDCS